MNSETSELKAKLNRSRNVLTTLLRVGVIGGFFTSLLWAHSNHHHHNLDTDEKALTHENVTSLLDGFFADSRIVELEENRRIAFRLSLMRTDASNWKNLNSLGWEITNIARSEQDESYYGLVERLAVINLGLNGKKPETLAIWIHALLQGHEFIKASEAAEELVGLRGNPMDYALRGDTAIEQGDLQTARSDYFEFLKKMPSLPSYARWGHLNWILGNREEAIGAWVKATEHGRARKSESVSWCQTKLAEIYLYSGELGEAKQLIDEVLSWKPDYAQAKFLKGRIDWFLGEKESAIECIEFAVGVDPLLERLWWLEDAYRSVGRSREADDVYERIIEQGPSIDRRATALYLSTREIGKNAALEMVRDEFENRSDGATMDALGLCLLRVGQFEASESSLLKSRDRGVVWGRRPLHLGMLALETGKPKSAIEFLNRAFEDRFAMTPSEIEALLKYQAKANVAILERELVRERPLRK